MFMFLLFHIYYIVIVVLSIQTTHLLLFGDQLGVWHSILGVVRIFMWILLFVMQASPHLAVQLDNGINSTEASAQSCPVTREDL